MARSPHPAESALLLPVLRGVMRLGWAQQMTPAAVELKWHQKRIDLAVCSNDFGLISIELKVSKWRKAIDQAYVNRWASTYSWVGVWHECITRDTYSYARDAGVGLLAVTQHTVYPLSYSDETTRPEAIRRFEDEVVSGGLRVRDLLSHARVTDGALA